MVCGFTSYLWLKCELRLGHSLGLDFPPRWTGHSTARLSAKMAAKATNTARRIGVEIPSKSYRVGDVVAELRTHRDDI